MSATLLELVKMLIQLLGVEVRIINFELEPESLIDRLL
jgi:hypothetical protein